MPTRAQAREHGYRRRQTVGEAEGDQRRHGYQRQAKPRRQPWSGRPAAAEGAEYEPRCTLHGAVAVDHNAMNVPICVNVQSREAARNSGTLTTNQTSRAAKRAIRASDSRLMPEEFERMPRNAASTSLGRSCPAAQRGPTPRPPRCRWPSRSAPPNPAAQQEISQEGIRRPTGHSSTL